MFSRLRWTKADSVLMRLIILLIMASTGLSLLFALLWIASRTAVGTALGMNEVTVYEPVDTPEASPDIALLDPDVTVGGTDRMVLTFHDPSTMERFLLVLPTLVFFSIVLACLWLLLQVTNSLAVGDPFVRANVRRIRAMALLVIIGALVHPLVEVFCQIALQEGVVPPDGLVLLGFSVGLGSVPFAVLLVGFALAALGEVFRRGSEMRDDVQGLV